MIRRRRLILILITLTPVALFLISAALYVRVRIRNVAANIDQVVVAELKQRLQRDVRVGRVTASPLGTFILYDLKIADGKNFTAGTLLAVKRVEVRYRWIDLISGRAPAIQAVDSVTLVQPLARLTHLRSGDWNISSLFRPPPGPKRPPFLGRVSIVGGQVVVYDHLGGPSRLRPTVNRLKDMEAMVDFSTPSSVKFAGKMKGARADRIEASGRYHIKGKTLDLDLKAQNADARYWGAYRPDLEPIRILAGRFDVQVSVAMTRQKPKWQYIGSAKLRRVAAEIPSASAPFSSVNGTVDFTNELLGLDLRGSFAGSPLNAKGAVVLAPKRSVRVTVESRSLDYARLSRALGFEARMKQISVSGTGSARALIVGRLPNIAVQGAAMIPQAAISGYRATGVNVAFQYANGVISLSRGTANTLGGKLIARGTIDIRDGRYFLDLSGSASGIRLQSIPPVRSAGLSGIVGGRFTMRGTATNPTLSATVKVLRGNFNVVAFSRASGTLYISRAGVVIRDMTASSSGGVVKMSGAVTPRKLDLRLSAYGVDAGRLLRQVGYQGYEGASYFSGRISGPPSDPTVVGNVEIFKGKIVGVEFEHARGHIAGNKAALAFSETTVQRYPAEATISGRITDIADRQPKLDLQFEVKQADVQELAKYLNIPITATGRLSGSFAVMGTVAEPSVSGEFNLVNAGVSGFSISQASGKIDYAAGALAVTDGVARTNGTTVTASGSLAADGTLKGSFSARPVALTGLNEALKPYFTLDGSANVAGNIGGTLKSPRVDVEAAAENITINGEKFDKAAVTGSYDGVTARLTDATINAAEETYQISGLAYNTEAKHAQVAAGIENGRIERIYRMIRNSEYLATERGQRWRSILNRVPKPITGAFTATAAASGKLDELRGELRSSMADASIGGQKIQSLELAVSADKGNVTLNNLAAVSGDMNLAASGDILKDNNINITVEAYNVDAAILQPWTGVSGITGTATISAVATGPILPKPMPTVQVSVEMVSPKIGGFEFDRIHTGGVLISTNQIELSDVVFTKNSYWGLLKGTVPWDWSTLTVPRDIPLSLHAELKKQPLALLSVLTSIVSPKGTGGTLDANVDIEGVLGPPQDILAAILDDLTGNLSVENGTINLAAFPMGSVDSPADFKNVNADVIFDRGNVRINKFSASSVRGGSLKANGIIGLAGFPNGPIDLALNANKLNIKEVNLSGSYDENISAVLTSNLMVTGTVARPVIAGNILVTDAQIKMPAAREAKAAKTFAILPAQTQFNVTATAGDDVWMYNPRLGAMVRGNGSLTGTLESPVIRASMTAQRGYIRLPTARPELRRGGTIEVLYAPPEPARVVLDLEATTNATARSTTGFPRRYNIIMTMRGPLDSLALDARSEPPGLTRDEIFALVGHVPGIFVPGSIVLEQELADLFTATIVPQVFSPVESAFEQAFGLEQFRLEFGAQVPTAVFLSKNLFGKYYLSHWRTVSAGQEFYRTSLSYRFTNRLQVTVLTTEQQETIFEVEGALRF